MRRVGRVIALVSAFGASLFLMTVAVGCGSTADPCAGLCGGSCTPCANGGSCSVPGDCASQTCVGGVCVAPTTGGTCSDFAKDGDETDVDCGGTACSPCGVGRDCVVPADCATGSCSTGHCVNTAFTPAAALFTVMSGSGITVMPGVQAGYGITATASTFRLVWTGDGTASGQYHEFYGSISTDGAISGVTAGCSGACQINSGDYVSAPYSLTGGQQVDFDSFNVNNLDGFDFTVAGGANGNGQPVYFDLYIDGQEQPTLVYFVDAATGAQSSPAADPFGLSAQ